MQVRALSTHVRQHRSVVIRFGGSEGTSVPTRLRTTLQKIREGSSEFGTGDTANELVLECGITLLYWAVRRLGDMYVRRDFDDIN